MVSLNRRCLSFSTNVLFISLPTLARSWKDSKNLYSESVSVIMFYRWTFEDLVRLFLLTHWPSDSHDTTWANSSDKFQLNFYDKTGLSWLFPGWKLNRLFCGFVLHVDFLKILTRKISFLIYQQIPLKELVNLFREDFLLVLGKVTRCILSLE